MKKSLQNLAVEIRKDVVRMHRKGSCVGAAMSIVDILTVLYFDVMRINAPNDPDRDRFVLSKGHAAAALYATLAARGFIKRELLDNFLGDGSALAGHPVAGGLPGIDVSTGSLGHGLPIAVGMALAAKRDGHAHRIFVVLGDGELQEGTVWEAAALAAALQLDNLVAVVDANNLQGYARVDALMPINSFSPKWQAFGWNTEEVDGHDVNALSGALKRVPFADSTPSIVIAHTVKGKGIAEMENEQAWHYFNVSEQKLGSFLEELDRHS